MTIATRNQDGGVFHVSRQPTNGKIKSSVIVYSL